MASGRQPNNTNMGSAQQSINDSDNSTDPFAGLPEYDPFNVADLSFISEFVDIEGLTSDTSDPNDDLSPHSSAQSGNGESETPNSSVDLPNSQVVMADGEDSGAVVANGVSCAGEASSSSSQALGSTLGTSPPEVSAPTPTPGPGMRPHPIPATPRQYGQNTQNMTSNGVVVPVLRSRVAPQAQNMNDLDTATRVFDEMNRRRAGNASYGAFGAGNQPSNSVYGTGMMAAPMQQFPQTPNPDYHSNLMHARAHGFESAPSHHQPRANFHASNPMASNSISGTFPQAPPMSMLPPSAYGNNFSGGSNAPQMTPGANLMVPLYQHGFDFNNPSQGHTQAPPCNPKGMLIGGATARTPNSNTQPRGSESGPATPTYGSYQAPSQGYGGGSASASQVPPGMLGGEADLAMFAGRLAGGGVDPRHNGSSGPFAIGTSPMPSAHGGAQVPAGIGGELDLAVLRGMLPDGAMDRMRGGISQQHASASGPTTPMHAPNHTPMQYFGGGASGTPSYGQGSITPQAQFPKHIPQSAPGYQSSPLAPQHQEGNRIQKKRGRPRKELGLGQQRNDHQQHNNTPQKSPLFTNDQGRLLHAWGLAAPTFPLPTSHPNPTEWTHNQKIDAVLCTNAARYIPLEKVRSLMDLCGFPARKPQGFADAKRELKRMEVDVVEAGVGAGGQGVVRGRVRKVGCAEVLFVFEKNGWSDHVDIEGM